MPDLPYTVPDTRDESLKTYDMGVASERSRILHLFHRRISDIAAGLEGGWYDFYECTVVRAEMDVLKDWARKLE